MNPVRPVSRVDSWSGVVFVLLVVASSATVSLPLSTDPSARISALYAEHRAAYVVAQLVGLLGVAALLWFLRTLRSYDETRSRRITVAGVLVALAGVGTNVAVLVLCFDTGLGPLGVHRAARATDVTDDVLFLAYALLMLAFAASGLPRWQRWLAAVAAAISLFDAAREWWEAPGINAVAPLGVLVVLGVVAVRTLRAPTVPVTLHLDTITRPM